MSYRPFEYEIVAEECNSSVGLLMFVCFPDIQALTNVTISLCHKLVFHRRLWWNHLILHTDLLGSRKFICKHYSYDDLSDAFDVCNRILQEDGR